MAQADNADSEHAILENGIVLVKNYSWSDNKKHNINTIYNINNINKSPKMVARFVHAHLWHRLRIGNVRPVAAGWVIFDL